MNNRLLFAILFVLTVAYAKVHIPEHTRSHSGSL